LPTIGLHLSHSFLALTTKPLQNALKVYTRLDDLRSSRPFLSSRKSTMAVQLIFSQTREFVPLCENNRTFVPLSRAHESTDPEAAVSLNILCMRCQALASKIESSRFCRVPVLNIIAPNERSAEITFSQLYSRAQLQSGVSSDCHLCSLLWYAIQFAPDLNSLT
jgi:hypothetical protein